MSERDETLATLMRPGDRTEDAYTYSYQDGWLGLQRWVNVWRWPDGHAIAMQSETPWHQVRR
jgi:hypothetical protein